MHHVLKLKVDRNFKFWDVVRSMEMSIMWLRHKESQDEFISSSTQPVFNATNMPSVEKEAANVYTRQIFLLVRAELKKEGKYIANALTAHENNIICRLLKYENVLTIVMLLFPRMTLNFIAFTSYCPQKEYHVGTYLVA